MKTYREDLVQATVAIEELMRSNFKKNNYPITYTYRGKTYDLRNRQARVEVIEEISTAYALAHAEFNELNKRDFFESGGDGEGPDTVPVDSTTLDRLTDIILYEELTDASKNKMSREEYSIMSPYQEERRRENEYEDVLADSYDVNGVNQAKPERRHRPERENRFVEKVARAKNRARKAQYRRDTSAGDIISYNLYENGGELTEPFVSCRGISKRWLDEMSAVNEITVEYVKEAA